MGMLISKHFDKVSNKEGHTRWQGVEHIAKQMQMAKYQVA